MIYWLRKLFSEKTVDERELELLDYMDKLQKLIADYDRQIKRCPKDIRLSFWYRKWEELVVLHMEFEWFFNPSNEENFYKIYE